MMYYGYPVYQQKIVFENDDSVSSKELLRVFSSLTYAEKYIDDMKLDFDKDPEVNWTKYISNPDIYGFYEENDDGIWMFYLGQRVRVEE